MDWTAAAAEWNNFRGVVRAHWCRFTEADLAEISGDRACLATRLQECYALSGHQVELQIRNFEARCDYFRVVSLR